MTLSYPWGDIIAELPLFRTKRRGPCHQDTTMVPRHDVSRSEIYLRASDGGLHSLGSVSDSTVPSHAVSSGHVSAPPSESVQAPRERFTPGGVTPDPHLRLP